MKNESIGSEKRSDEFWTECISDGSDRYFKKGYVYKCWETGIEGIWGHRDQNGNEHKASAAQFRKFETVESWMLTDEEQEEEERKFIEKVSSEVINDLKPDDRKYLLENPDGDYHFNLGLYIRNIYIHGKKFPFLVIEPDYLSDLIIHRIIERLREANQNLQVASPIQIFAPSQIVTE